MTSQSWEFHAEEIWVMHRKEGNFLRKIYRISSTVKKNKQIMTELFEVEKTNFNVIGM